MRMYLLASALLISATACAPPSEGGPPDKLLGNPVVDARAALADGDSTFLGIFDQDLELPGTDSSVVIGAERRYRLFSRRSLGLSSDSWEAQRDSLRVYAAAYNRLILDARQATRLGAS